jgi:antitoxin ParD1/3/4
LGVEVANQIKKPVAVYIFSARIVNSTNVEMTRQGNLGKKDKFDNKHCYLLLSMLGFSQRSYLSMNISLTPELEELVHQKVASGLYHSASEVIREGLRLLKEQDALKEYRLEELRREIRVGLEQSARGESAPLDMDAVKEEVRKRTPKKQKSA